MFPESRTSGAIARYRCLRFPDRWAFEKVRWKERAVDTTVWSDHSS
jgi:hypothetical protein